MAIGDFFKVLQNMHAYVQLMVKLNSVKSVSRLKNNFSNGIRWPNSYGYMSSLLVEFILLMDIYNINKDLPPLCQQQQNKKLKIHAAAG